MNTTKKFMLALCATGLSLGVAACDGPKENAMEDAGEQHAEAVNDKAETMEAQGKITDDQADAMTKKAEDKADAMEKQGEAADNANGH
ncbi:hypothetical protein GRI58_11015 [Porphyrobacter algicida]|uniref:Uncharacterized protein n=1 Tax=Qipengyuania algicida TaxID=1836209 RepID=A0A845AFM4_9SPHN|nr:hypothetical protein [Qipengyuania algicida]MXP29352.1 hypothetical protein [Qipengyuania algicida]